MYLIEVSVARRYRVAAENRYEAEEIAIAYFTESSISVEEEALAETIEDYGGLVDATLDAKGILLGGPLTEDNTLGRLHVPGTDYYDGRDGSIEAEDDDEDRIAEEDAAREEWSEYLEWQRDLGATPSLRWDG